MIEIASCPECDKKLKVPENLLGKKVRCPGCSLTFIANPDADVAEETRQPPSSPPVPPKRSDAYSDQRPGTSSKSIRGRSAADDSRERDQEADEDDDRRSRRRDDEDEDDRRPPRGDRDDDDDDDRRPRRRDRIDDDSPRRGKVDLPTKWGRVRLGITLAIIASCTFAGSVVLNLVGNLVFQTGVAIGVATETAANAVGQFGKAGVGSTLFVCLMGLLSLAEFMLRLLGYGLCMQIPAKRKSAAKGLAIAAFSCAAGAVVFGFIAEFIVALSSGIGGGGTTGFARAGIGTGFDLVRALSGSFTLASFICWLFFLRSLAVQLRYDDLAKQIVVYMFSCLGLFAAAFLFGVIIAVVGIRSLPSPGRVPGAGAGAGAALFSLCFGGVFLIAGLVMYGWYIRLMTQAGYLVDEKVARM